MRVSPLFALSASLSLPVAAGLATSFDDPGVLNAVAADVKASENADTLELAHSLVNHEQENRGFAPVEAAEDLVKHAIVPLTRLAESSKSKHREEQGELERLVHGRQSVESDIPRSVIGVHHEEDTRLSSDSQSIMSGKRAEVVAPHQQGSVDPRFNEEEYKVACERVLPHYVIAGYDNMVRIYRGPFATLLKTRKWTAHFPPDVVVKLDETQFFSWFKSKIGPELVLQNAQRAGVSEEQQIIANAVANDYDKFIDQTLRLARGYDLPRPDKRKLGKNSLFATITSDEFDAMCEVVHDDVEISSDSYKPHLKSLGNIPTQRWIHQMKKHTDGTEEEAAILERQQFSVWIVNRVEPVLARAQVDSVSESFVDLLSLHSVVNDYEQFVETVLGKVRERERKRKRVVLLSDSE
uniref:RxLR effector candidate protein n=1 Tax=Hyaloperonospora arabidopsidis (strain Emoy2) TaxID=559515 RepID=M4C502_HYAAE